MTGDRARRLAISSLEQLLRRSGHTDERARREALDWAKTRRAALRQRRRIVAGTAATVTAPGRVELRPVERLLAGPGQVTVETLLTAISPGTERAQWVRLPAAQPRFPYTPGYSGVATVVASGMVAGPRPGSTVAVLRLPHASLATLPASWVVPVPNGVPHEAAALVYLAVIAGYGVERGGDLTGRSVCVLGAGPVGALAARLAALQAPAATTVVATSRRRAAAALAAGIDRFLTVGEGVGSIGADVVIEATGDPSAIHAAIDAAAPGGTIVLLGSPRGTSPAVRIDLLRERRLRLVGAHISSLATAARRRPGDPFATWAGTFLDGVRSGRLVVSDLVGDPADPRELALVYRRLAHGDIDAAHLDWRRLPPQERFRRVGYLHGPVLAPPSPPPVATRSVGPAATAEALQRLRVAVIGCGDIGASNARAVQRAANAELAVAYDPQEALAFAAAGGAPVARTLDDALDPARVDAVILSVPHDQHAPLVERAAAAGLHVLVEKPLAVDLPSAHRATDAAAHAGVVLSVAFPFRYESAVLTARRLVEEGAIGTFLGASVTFHADKPDAYWTGGFSGRAFSDWRTRRDRAGGGVLIMNLTHYLDFIRHVVGVEVDAIEAMARTPEGLEVEEAITANIRFANGAIGSILGSAATRGGPANRFELWGEDGTIVLEPDAAVYTDRALPGVVPGRWNRIGEEQGQRPRTVMVERFAEAVLQGRPPDVTARDGLAVQAIVAAAYEAAAREGVVEVVAT